MDADSQHLLIVPAIALDLIGVTALAAETLGCEPHADHL